MVTNRHFGQEQRNGILYPTLLIAAIAVIIFSVLGIATMMGFVPNVFSRSGSQTSRESAGDADAERAKSPESPPAAKLEKPPAPKAGDASCVNCGVVESIRAVESKGGGSGLGAVAGGVIGGILGNQIGRGGGRTAMTVVGAGAGAFTGNEVEKNMNKAVTYQIRVRMNDGTFRTFYERSQPALGVGQRVRVTNTGIISAN